MCQVSITTPVLSTPSITSSASSMLFTLTSKGMNS